MVFGSSKYENRWNYKYNYDTKYQIKKEYMNKLEKYKFKRVIGANNYYRVYIPKLFKVIPLFLSKRRTTVVIAGDRTIYIVDNLGFKRLAQRNDKEIQDFKIASLLV